MSDKLDITNLRGGDLWDALSSGKQLVTKKPPKPISPRPSLRWQDERLVFLIHEVHCEGCDHAYEYPNADIFLRRIAKDNSVHYARLEHNIPDPEARFMNLEIITEHRQSSVSACQFCCDLAHIIERARSKKNDKPLSDSTPLSLPPTEVEPPETSSLDDLLSNIPSTPVLTG